MIPRDIWELCLVGHYAWLCEKSLKQVLIRLIETVQNSILIKRHTSEYNKMKLNDIKISDAFMLTRILYQNIVIK